MFDHVAKGRLPAGFLSPAVLAELKEILEINDVERWQADVGTGGDMLGKDTERPSLLMDNWQELTTLLSQLPRIDSLNITAESANRGVIAIAFRNYPPAGGSYVITGTSAEWVAEKTAAVQKVFARQGDDKANRLYNRWVFGAIQTAIPLAIACIAVLTVAFFIVPRSLVTGDYIWWVTTATVMATLWLGHGISDRFILRVIERYPYLRWKQDNA